MYTNNVCIFHLFFSFCTNHPPLQIAYDNLNMCRTLFLSSGILKFEWHKRNKHNKIMLAESDECHKRYTKCYGLQVHKAACIHLLSVGCGWLRAACLTGTDALPQVAPLSIPPVHLTEQGGTC